MNAVGHARLRAALLASILSCALASRAGAQPAAPFGDYRFFQTAHFLVTFEAGLDEYARRAAAQAETAYARLTRAYGSAPRGRIRLVVVDQGDFFNGSATPVPTNRILVLANTPVENETFFTDDPSELITTHELAHVFHLDQARRGWRVLRAVFGRNELTFPHLLDGSWLIEGLATFFESSLTGEGRVRGARFREILRASVLETDGPHLDEAEADPGAWPPDRHYVFGALFLDHLAARYGAAAIPAWMERRAGSVGSIVSRGAAIGPLFGGMRLSDLWTAWIAEEYEGATRLRERLAATAPGLTPASRICGVAHATSFPRVSPDGSRVAFLTTDEGRRPLGLYVADLKACKPRRVTRVNSAHTFGWTPDGASIVYSQFEVIDNRRSFAELFRVDVASGRVTRLTRGARLTSPDVHPSGRTVVAVQYDGSRSRLVAFDLESGTLSPLTEFSNETAWGPARWSPDGAQLAAIRFLRGTAYDLVLLSADGRLLQTLTADRALEGIPEWDSTPAGTRRVFVTSGRTGIRELYSVELDEDRPPRLYAAGRVATGVHDLAIVPSDAASNRTTIVATVTHADGQHLERFDIDRTAMVDAPAPAPEFALLPATKDTTLPGIDARPSSPYAPARDLLPTGWSPVLATVGEIGAFVGAATGGIDVIGRHAWQGRAAIGPDGRVMGAATYVYRRFARAELFGQASSTWRLEQRLETEGGELLRLERRRSAAIGINVPWRTARRSTVLSANVEVQHRDREYGGRTASVAAAANPLVRVPTLAGGGLAFSFRNTQSGVRSISEQDGVRAFASASYLKATSDERWRAGWEMALSTYRSLPSWTRDGRPVIAAAVRVAEERGPAASLLTAGGLATTAVFEGGSSTNVEVRGYPPGFVAAGALWGARTELRLPVARVSRGLGASPFYLRGFSGTWFVDSVGGAGRVSRLGSPQLLSTGAEVASDISLFSFAVLRIRTGVGVPLKSLGPVGRGDARVYVTAGTSF